MLTLLATLFSARSAEPTCVVADPEPGDPRLIQLEWSREDGRVIPELALSGIDAGTLSYTVNFKMGFAGKEVAWTAGPFELGALESEAVPLDIPPEAYMSREQTKYGSTLVVTVYGRDVVSDAIVASQTAPRLRLVYNSERTAFDLYEASEFAAVAPYGFVGEPPAGVAEILEQVLAEGDRSNSFQSTKFIPVNPDGEDLRNEFRSSVSGDACSSRGRRSTQCPDLLPA